MPVVVETRVVLPLITSGAAQVSPPTTGVEVVTLSENGPEELVEPSTQMKYVPAG